jgi:hypothetical protein
MGEGFGNNNNIKPVLQAQSPHQGQQIGAMTLAIL